MRLFSFGLASLGMISALALPANASDRPHWYTGISGSVVFLEDVEIRDSVAKYELEMDTGGGVAGAVGYAFPLRRPLGDVRIEAEGGYRWAKSKSLRVAGFTVPFKGEADIYSYMGNLYYDFRNTTPWTPYIGAGLGGATVQWTIDNEDAHQTALAYQLMAGLSYKPDSWQSTELNLGYRFFDTSQLRFRDRSTGVVTSADVTAHGVEAGVKFLF